MLVKSIFPFHPLSPSPVMCQKAYNVNDSQHNNERKFSVLFLCLLLIYPQTCWLYTINFNDDVSHVNITSGVTCWRWEDSFECVNIDRRLLRTEHGTRILMIRGENRILEDNDLLRFLTTVTILISSQKKSQQSWCFYIFLWNKFKELFYFWFCYSKFLSSHGKESVYYSIRGALRRNNAEYSWNVGIKTSRRKR